MIQCLLTSNWRGGSNSWPHSWLYIIAFIALSLGQANVIHCNVTGTTPFKGIKNDLKSEKKKKIEFYDLMNHFQLLTLYHSVFSWMLLFPLCFTLVLQSGEGIRDETEFLTKHNSTVQIVWIIPRNVVAFLFKWWTQLKNIKYLCFIYM